MDIGPLSDDILGAVAHVARPPDPEPEPEPETLEEQYERYGRVKSMLAGTSLEPDAEIREITRPVTRARMVGAVWPPLGVPGTGDLIWDWCQGCDRVTFAPFMEWRTPDTYRCWQCTRGIAIPEVAPDDRGP